MRLTYLLSTVLMLSVCLFSCQKGSQTGVMPAQQQLIVGKWTLQTEHAVRYVDGVKQIDTVYNASENSYVTMQFNNDNTFVTLGVFAIGDPGNLSSGVSVENFSANGTYKFTGTVFSMVGPVAGFGNGAVYALTGSNGLPVIKAVSNVIQINTLTTTSLALHNEYVYTYTLNGTTQTYKQVNDLSYTK